jgi:hypothetical protein
MRQPATGTDTFLTGTAASGSFTSVVVTEDAALPMFMGVFVSSSSPPLGLAKAVRHSFFYKEGYEVVKRSNDRASSLGMDPYLNL